jgi:hypothetical protein
MNWYKEEREGKGVSVEEDLEEHLSLLIYPPPPLGVVYYTRERYHFANLEQRSARV